MDTGLSFGVMHSEWKHWHAPESPISARPKSFVVGSAGSSAKGVRRDKAALFQWVQAPPGDRSSRKQPEQAWRERNVLKPSDSGHELVTARVCRP